MLSRDLFPHTDMSNISLVWDVKRSLWCVWLFANPPLVEQRFYFLFTALSFSSNPARVRLKSPPFIQINKAGGAASFMWRQGEGFKPHGSRPRRDNDVCFVCSSNPPFNTPHAPFNRLLLLCVLTTSLPWPFHFFWNLFLWITDRVFISPPAPPSLPFRGSGGEELLLV